MEEEKRTYLSETVGLPLKMVLVQTEGEDRAKDAGIAVRPRGPQEQGEKAAAVLRLIQHLNKKA